MTQKQMINAYITLVRLGGAQMSVRAAHTLYQLRKKLESSYQFCSEREQLIIEKYHGKIVNGTITFDNEEAAQCAQADLRDLYDLDIDAGIEAVILSMDDIKGVSLSVNDMEALEGFVVLT